MMWVCPRHTPIASLTVAGASKPARCPTIFTTRSTPKPSPRIGRPVKHDLSGWTVTDDWPEHIPVTEAVFEAWFGDLLDEFFGPCR